MFNFPTLAFFNASQTTNLCRRTAHAVRMVKMPSVNRTAHRFPGILLSLSIPFRFRLPPVGCYLLARLRGHYTPSPNSPPPFPFPKPSQTYLPLLVMTISVPSLWNFSHSSLPSSVTFGSSTTPSSSGCIARSGAAGDY